MHISKVTTSEKHFIICDAELYVVEHAGKRAMVVRAFYGGKLAGRYFWMHMRPCIDTLGFTSCFSDPHVWMRNSKHGYGTDYCECELLYVDYCLVISNNAENFIRENISKYFELNQESIKPPDMNLGGHMRQVTLDNGVK